MIINYMEYVIFFQSQADYDFAVAVAGGNLLELSPRGAATLFGIPHPYPSGDMDAIPKGIYFPSVFFPGSTITWGPNPTGFVADDALDQIGPVPAQAGVPASTWPANSPAKDGLFIWSGVIIRSRGAGAGVTPPPTAIAKRRFCIGFESAETQLEGSGSATSSWTSRDASRTIDGRGFAIRGANFGFFNVLVAVLQPGFTTSTSHERFYIRVRRLPAITDIGFWRTNGTTAPACGFRLRLKTDGTIHGININAINAEFDAGVVFAPTINTWYRVDIFLRYEAAGLGTHGNIEIYINGTHAFSFADVTGFGMNGSAGHGSTNFGRENGSDAEVEIDLDDWVSSDLPGNMNSSLAFLDNNFSIDWLLGSHIRKHFVTAATQVNFTPAGSFGLLNQGDNPPLQQGELTSSTPLAQIVGLTDALLQSQPDTIANVLGAVSAVIGITSRNAGATDGKLGYKKAGGGAILTTINEIGGNSQNYVGYLPTGMFIPDEISPFSVVYEKSNDGNAAVVNNISAEVEYIGVWAEEDDPVFTFPTSRLTFLHNCVYGNTQWGYTGSQPDAPVIIKGGTYAGNSQTQTIPLPGPCNWLWIRCTDGGGSGVLLWAAPNYGAVKTDNNQAIPALRVWSDIDQTFKFQVSGATNLLNLTGKTYQYIAFIDPGMRFNLAGVQGHGNTASSPKANPLINSQFLAEGGFGWPQYSQAGGTTAAVYKGPGIGANRASLLNGGAAITSYMNFAAGVLNTLSGIFIDAPMVYSLWRTQDGGPAGCSGNVEVQILQYTGDGNASKNVVLTPTSGRFPIFVMAVPDGGSNGYFRDPSHAGANSSFITNNGLTVNAIIAVAIDQITVGSQLNNLGQVYSVFAICGDTAGMNNGTYQATYCGSNPGGPYTPPKPPQGDINVIGDGGLTLNGQPATLLLKDVSGIYTLITGKRNDTLIDRQTGQPSVDVEIPDPTFKTGYIGG